MTGVPPPGLAGAFRRMALPLGAYYAVTLALPLANGAARSGTAFGAHAAVVLVVPPLLVALGYAAHRLAAGIGRGACHRHPRNRSGTRAASRTAL